MQENITIARPYASAVFELAQQESNLKKWSGMLQILNLVVSDDNMQQVIKNPKVDHDQLAGIVIDICGGELDKYGKNFVKTLVNAGRLTLIPYIYKLYEARKAEAEGIAEVNVISAYPLEGEQQSRIKHVMEKRLGKKIEITTKVDETLIGGAVIRAGDSVIDASLRGRLKQLGHNFAE